MAKKCFPLRVDENIFAAVESWAADDLRSVNGHIEFLLREALKKSGRLPAARQKKTKNQEE